MEKACDLRSVALLTHAGMMQEEAVRINDDDFAFETMIARASREDDYLESIYNPVTIAEMEALSLSYPIAVLLKTYIDAGVYSFILGEPHWLARVNILRILSKLS